MNPIHGLDIKDCLIIFLTGHFVTNFVLVSVGLACWFLSHFNYWR